MRIIKDKLWTWLLPDVESSADKEEWLRHGGKWIIFDRKDAIEKLSERLKPYIESGEILCAKYWNGNPSAINVYLLDRDKERVWEILKTLGASNSKVWEYDYAFDKNIRNPIQFIYSWCSKFRTILQSYGLLGTINLIREILKSGKNTKDH
jgi:hypothetical protein